MTVNEKYKKDEAPCAPFKTLIESMLRVSSKMLGIPIVSSVEELNRYPIVIFASTHYNSNEPKELKEILLQKLKNSDKKTILALEFYSDKWLEDLFNDPKRNLNDERLNQLISSLVYEKTIRELIKVFNEIQQKYPRDKFEIKLVDITLEEKNFETRDARDNRILENIQDLLKTCGDKNFVVYIGKNHAVDLLDLLIELLQKSGNIDWIKPNNISVFVAPPGDPNIHIEITVFSPDEDLKNSMRK